MSESASSPPPDGDLVARPDRTYRIKWVAVGLLMLGWGWWSLYDGFVAWERENERAIQEAREQGRPIPEKLPHDQLGIQLNRLIGIALQPVGAFLIFWALHSSRGVYRLEGATLHVPGHPPVPLDAIREIDKSKWERKGIAYLRYEVPGSVGPQTGRLKLDDYVYERGPTDQILARIEAAVAPAEA